MFLLKEAALSLLMQNIRIFTAFIIYLLFCFFFPPLYKLYI